MDQSATSILLFCLGYTSEADGTKLLAEVTAEEWRLIAALAYQHGVGQLLYHRIKSKNIAISEEVAGKLKEKYQQNAMRNMSLYQELHRLLGVFQEKDIPIIVLKGAYLAEAVYENIALRPMGDLDLLVNIDNLSRIEQELLALGYQPMDCNRVIAQENYHFSYQLPEHGIHVEIHWSLFIRKNPLQFDEGGLWSRSQTVTIAQTTTRTLSPEDLLLHLCHHTARHTYDMRLRMFSDIGELIKRQGSQLDWEKIGARARLWGIQHSLYFILRLARELLDVPVPQDVLASFLPEDFKEDYLALARQKIFIFSTENSMGKTEKIARLWNPIGLRKKIELIRYRLLPPRETMALMYPAPANSWRIYFYYPVRLRDVLVRHGATLWQLARGDSKAQAFAEHTNQITSLRDWLISG